MRPTVTSCPRPSEWLRLVDGEVTENRAADLRDHAAGCSACASELAGVEALVSRVASPVPGVPSERALAEVMARLDEAPHRAGRRSRAFLLGGATGLAAAAALLVAISPWEEPESRGILAARGGEVQWSRKVGVEIWAIEEPLRRLAPGDAFAPGTPLVGSYSNVDDAPAWLLAFALDAASEVSWLYPAFLDPASDPLAVRLEPSVVQHAFAESAVLEGLAPGPVRFVLLVSREPLRVSDVERLAPAEREPDRLRARWPAARIDVVPAVVSAHPRGAGQEVPR